MWQRNSHLSFWKVIKCNIAPVLELKSFFFPWVLLFGLSTNFIKVKPVWNLGADPGCDGINMAWLGYHALMLSAATLLCLSVSGIAPELNWSQLHAICHGGQSGKVIDLSGRRWLLLGLLSVASGSCTVEQISSSKRQCGEQQASLKAAFSSCCDLCMMLKLVWSLGGHNCQWASVKWAEARWIKKFGRHSA